MFIYSAILLSNKKNPVIFANTDETEGHFTKWNNLDIKGKSTAWSHHLWKLKVDVLKTD